ncbi:hypothetical protein CEXT_571621 [Caerostris extrusa]|uniref:Uncharacterized protein n=1 Tax=Caerostris extrusa TaxID=172846 RepID=A0AAV4WEX8_CAEEX|nr:hypothetical protein CEXT_571621 [Caerostris extrusa]
MLSCCLLQKLSKSSDRTIMDAQTGLESEPLPTCKCHDCRVETEESVRCYFVIHSSCVLEGIRRKFRSDSIRFPFAWRREAQPRCLASAEREGIDRRKNVLDTNQLAKRGGKNGMWRIFHLLGNANNVAVTVTGREWKISIGCHAQGRLQGPIKGLVA